MGSGLARTHRQGDSRDLFLWRALSAVHEEATGVRCFVADGVSLVIVARLCGVIEACIINLGMIN